ncbi:RNA polymerase sigma-70 factor [Prolixibacteraceae bacterium Z1-6]|uniref:RNA polymerase sigma-70 factor n=1 Tax=Draconibacterium aestuarii TaxID=2998507 RepID=A0A9X3FCG1_9BACT|nr:RNA polymerase sigma-70 factor [Prolixibacteraceae bacterium Z1-6]
MEERVLIEGIRQRNQLVFEYIFEYYYSGLCVFCLNYINDKLVVEDIVQEFFLYLWSEAHSLEINTSLRSYMFSAVKYKCLDYKKHLVVKDKFNSYVKENNEVSNNDVFDHYVESELREIIQKELDKLPKRCREIFILSRFKGKSNLEIAEQLNISKRTVEIQISNALKVLKVSLKDYLFLLPIFFR